MDLPRCSDNIFLFVNYIWWFPSSSVAWFWILRSQAELAAWPYDFRRVPALRESPVNPMGCFFEGWRKMLKKDGWFFSPINDERFMGFLMCFFLNMFYIYICAVCICFYMFLNMYICVFFPPWTMGEETSGGPSWKFEQRGRRLEGWHPWESW